MAKRKVTTCEELLEKNNRHRVLTLYEYKLINRHIKKFGVDDTIKSIVQDVLSRNDLGELWSFATDIKGLDIVPFEDKIIESKNGIMIYQFACSVNNANISRLEDGVIKSGSAVAIYQFARDVKGANIEKLRVGIEKTGDKFYIGMYIKFIINKEVIDEDEALRIMNEYGLWVLILKKIKKF